VTWNFGINSSCGARQCPFGKGQIGGGQTSGKVNKGKEKLNWGDSRRAARKKVKLAAGKPFRTGAMGKRKTMPRDRNGEGGGIEEKGRIRTDSRRG